MTPQQRLVAAQTFLAYNAMTTSKMRHMTVLEAMELRKSKFNLSPSEEEKALLSNLLRDHDEQVKAFQSASKHLRAQDSEAFDALFVYLGGLEKSLAVYSQD